MNKAKQLKEQEAEEAERNFAKECAAYNQSKRERGSVNEKEIFWSRRQG